MSKAFTRGWQDVFDILLICCQHADNNFTTSYQHFAIMLTTCSILPWFWWWIWIWIWCYYIIIIVISVSTARLAIVRHRCCHCYCIHVLANMCQVHVHWLRWSLRYVGIRRLYARVPEVHMWGARTPTQTPTKNWRLVLGSEQCSFVKATICEWTCACPLKRCVRAKECGSHIEKVRLRKLRMQLDRERSPLGVSRR